MQISSTANQEEKGMRELKPQRNEKYDLRQLSKAREEGWAGTRSDFPQKKGRFIQGRDPERKILDQR